MHIKEFRKHYELEEIDIKLSNKNFFKNALSIFPYFSLCWNYKEAYSRIKEPDFLYIRKVGGDRKQYMFLKYIKKTFPTCKIIIEIPTYPYFRESVKSLVGILVLKDYWNYCYKLGKYIDRFLTYSLYGEIFKVPTIKVKNGIDVNSIPPIERDKIYDKETIRLLAVAVLQPHHGYERLIKGIYNYYKDGGNRKIYFHLVGEGPQKKTYMKLADKYQLSENIIFHGGKFGKELHELYEEVDLTVSTLGFYKDGVDKSSVLKVREYLAKGLPVISGCREDAFDDGEKTYCCEFPNNSSAIDMERVIKFYDGIYEQKSRLDVVKEIRKFALESVDNAITMKPLFAYLNSENGR